MDWQIAAIAGRAYIGLHQTPPPPPPTTTTTNTIHVSTKQTNGSHLTNTKRPTPFSHSIPVVV